MASARRLLYMATVWPEASSSAAGVRSAGMLEALTQAGWDITVSSACAPNAFMKQLQVATGITAVHTPLNDTFAAKDLLSGEAAFNAKRTAAAGGSTQSELDEDRGTQDGPPDVVLFDRFVEEEKFGHFVADFAPDAATILDTQDLHAVRRSRQAYVQQRGWEATIAGACAALPSVDDPTLIREIAAMARCDLTLVCSDWEKHYLRDVCNLPQHKVALASFYYPPLLKRIAPIQPGNASCPTMADFKARDGFAFIGNFRHVPNADAVQWLVRLWPHVRARLPDAKLHIYGAYPGQQHMALHAPRKGIHVHGHVADISAPLRKHRVMLAPLRYGAGVKGKVLDAWAHGMPVVTTPIGAEGVLPLDSVLSPPRQYHASTAHTAPRRAVQAGPADADATVRGGRLGEEWGGPALPSLPAGVVSMSYDTAGPSGRRSRYAAISPGMPCDDPYRSIAQLPTWEGHLRGASSAGWRVGKPLPRSLSDTIAEAIRGGFTSSGGGSSDGEEEAAQRQAKLPRVDLTRFHQALLCEDEAALVETAVAMHSEPGLWASCVHAGQALVTDRFAAATNGPNFASIVAGVAASLPARRSADLPRAVLLHGQAAYTKYFSRYIELKESMRKQQNAEDAQEES